MGVTLAVAPAQAQDNSGLPMVTIVTAATASMVGSALEFTLTRDGSTDATLTVALNVTQVGSFIKTSDGYTAPTSVEFAAGSATATVAVETEERAEDAVNGSVTITVTAAGNAGYRAGDPASATVTVRNPFTVSFVADGLPATHTGISLQRFRIKVRFSRDLGAYQMLTDAVSVSNGTRDGQERVSQNQSREWWLHVRPQNKREVLVTLPAAESCPENDTDYFCSADGEPLSNTLSTWIRGPNSSPARLGSLELDGLDLSPAFSPWTFWYTANVFGSAPKGQSFWHYFPANRIGRYLTCRSSGSRSKRTSCRYAKGDMTSKYQSAVCTAWGLLCDRTSRGDWCVFVSREPASPGQRLTSDTPKGWEDQRRACMAPGAGSSPSGLGRTSKIRRAAKLDQKTVPPGTMGAPTRRGHL